METIFLDEDIVIFTENVIGEIYLLKAKSIQDIFNDWNGDCEFVPSNDAKVYFASLNGNPIDSYKYTDFGTLMEYLIDLQRRL